MSRVIGAVVLAMLLTIAPATRNVLSARRVQERAGIKQAARWEDDEEGEEVVGAFTPVSEAEEMEANGDEVDDDSSDDSSPDDDEPEDVEDNTVPSGFEEAAYDSGAD